MKKIFIILICFGVFSVCITCAKSHPLTISYPTVFCHDTTIIYTCGTEQYFDGWYALHLPSNYTGDILKIEFQCLINSCIAYVFGAFPSLVDISSVGPPCYTTPSFTTNLTVSLPAGTCTSGGYCEFHIHVDFKSPPDCPLKFKLDNLVFPNPCDSIDLPCTDCLPSFSPQPDSTYIISAWVKQSDFSYATTTYTSANIIVDFTPTSNPTTYYGSGQIIDGWQRIEGSFVVPHDAQEFKLILGSGIHAWFDDIRIYPLHGSMKTYVFDPLTLRLTAELDERNYATIYEYDEEGHLTRVKKETERGIMTIQENKTATAK